MTNPTFPPSDPAAPFPAGTLGAPPLGAGTPLGTYPPPAAPDAATPHDGAGGGAGDDGRGFRVQEPSRPASRRNLVSWGITLVIALVLTFVVKTYVFQAYSIPSESMVPTLLVGDRVLVSKLNTDPGRGDVVVFNRPPSDPARGPDDPPVLIKRVIGLPGETITAQDGEVYVNGKRLVEDYLPKQASSKTVISTPIVVPNDQLLVLGDNRSISFDGRNFGTISKSLIVGRAIVRIWPLSRLGSI